MRKLSVILLSSVLAFGLSVPALAEAENTAKSDDIVILYTNDVHTHIDSEISYDTISALKQNLMNDYKYVFLVDAGDHIQGTAYGSVDKGENIINMMNLAGYDLAALGNHEFDYGMDGRITATDEWADFPYISCNFYHEEDGVRGENVLNSYQLFECGEEKIAIIGITTPETITKSTPAYFQNENGEYIYGIAGGKDGQDLYNNVQTAIDEVKAAGATKVIALGHLGTDLSSQPWTSEETIANICGLDAFIDGHSHSTIEEMIVADEDGHSVLLTQSGEYFEHIGMMTIDAETDEITTKLLSPEDLADLTADEEVKVLKDSWMTEIETQLGQVIASADITFQNSKGENDEWLVRSQETNAGDFCADALYYLFDDLGMDVDIAITNGGGIRNGSITGDISYLTCKDIHPFGNVACLQTVTGQQILDALEWGARKIGSGYYSGGFLHVAGLSYRINTSIPDTTQATEEEIWTGGPTGDYRVYDVLVYNKELDAYEALDLNATYNLAGYNYTLRELGDGFAMFDGAVNVLDYVMEDYLVLANYASAFDGGIGAYNSPLLEKYPCMMLDYEFGSNRICACSDEDGNHYCDRCWAVVNECIDENHDHICDACGSTPVFINQDMSDGWTCDACGKSAVNLEGQYLSLNHRINNEGAILVSGTVSITAQSADLNNEAIPMGTVSAGWMDYIVTANTDSETITIDFTDIPMEALYCCSLQFRPSEDSSFMPQNTDIFIDNAAYALDVWGDVNISINGLNTNSLWFLPGTEVSIIVDSEDPFNLVFDTYSGCRPEDTAIENNTVTFTMPEDRVYMEIVIGEVYDVWVDGIQITEYNKDDLRYDGTISYDPETSTLTLENTNLSSYTRDNGSIDAIRSLNDLNIVVNGSNVIDLSYTLTADANSTGINVEGNLNISGDGTLDIFCGNANGESTGISASGEVAVEDTVKITEIPAEKYETNFS